MAKSDPYLKRKKRASKSSGLESDICSPHNKKVHASNCDTMLSESDISEASFNATDQVNPSLKMSDKDAKQLQAKFLIDCTVWKRNSRVRKAFLPRYLDWANHGLQT